MEAHLFRLTNSCAIKVLRNPHLFFPEKKRARTEENINKTKTFHKFPKSFQIIIIYAAAI